MTNSPLISCTDGEVTRWAVEREDIGGGRSCWWIVRVYPDGHTHRVKHCATESDAQAIIGRWPKGEG